MKVDILILIKDKGEANKLLNEDYRQNSNDYKFNEFYGKFKYQHVDNVNGRIFFLRTFNKI